MEIVAWVLVAAGVVLGGNQDKARTGRGGFRRCGMAECAQDAEDCDVSGEDAEADGSDHGEAENEGHQERNHGPKILPVMSEASYFVSASRNSVFGPFARLRAS